MFVNVEINSSHISQKSQNELGGRGRKNRGNKNSNNSKENKKNFEKQKPSECIRREQTKQTITQQIMFYVNVQDYVWIGLVCLMVLLLLLLLLMGGMVWNEPLGLGLY